MAVAMDAILYEKGTDDRLGACRCSLHPGESPGVLRGDMALSRTARYLVLQLACDTGAEQKLLEQVRLLLKDDNTDSTRGLILWFARRNGFADLDTKWTRIAIIPDERACAFVFRTNVVLSGRHIRCLDNKDWVISIGW